VASISGGRKFESALRTIAAKVSKPATLRVGILEGARYPNGTSVAMVAAIQEFGAPKARIPPRPFFRNMIAAKKGEWPAAIAGLLKENDYDAEKALDIAGAAIAGQLRESIINTNAPPLRPITLMLRKWFPDRVGMTGRDVGRAAAAVAAGESFAGAPTKPLVWTGLLLNSVDHEVTS
jgi:hypothetical protein